MDGEGVKKKTRKRPIFFWILLILGVIWFFRIISIGFEGISKEIPYSDFYTYLKDNPSTNKIRSITKVENLLHGEFSDGSKFSVIIPEEDKEIISLIRENVGRFVIRPTRTIWSNLFYTLGPIALLFLFWWMMAARGQELGNRIFSFGKARARAITEKEGPKITFSDAAGVDEAKEELKEVIEFLKDPKKFQRLGGRIPKGVLLVGPPGCGKTLLARAVAGEASVPFYSISGSDFVEMFVGVGASRVRDLFEQGRKASKASGKGAIIFIDEIDAVGRLRFAGLGGGHDEREQTLNQLLVEMDGFDAGEGIILIAATNRPDTLDPALLRPGRFDRHIVINLPDILGREEILKVHTRKIKLAENVNLRTIAQQTSGFSGADLANLCNEAALLAARKNRDSVTQEELESAIERVIMGPERKSRVISKYEKEIAAYHESGHALLSLLIPEADPLRKVSIIPRGLAGGYTLTPPTEDRRYWTKKELLGRLAVALGGRVSEELNLGEMTTGAESDLTIVTNIARKMVCEFGMSERLGNITLGRREGLIFLGRDIVEERNYSEETAKIIDEEVKKITDEAYLRAKKLLVENQDKLRLLAQTLMEKETLDAEQVKKLLGLPQKDSS